MSNIFDQSDVAIPTPRDYEAMAELSVVRRIVEEREKAFQKARLERAMLRRALKDLYPHNDSLQKSQQELQLDAQSLIERNGVNLQELEVALAGIQAAYYCARGTYMRSLRRLADLSTTEQEYKLDVMKSVGLGSYIPEDVLYYQYVDGLYVFAHLFYGGMYGEPDGPGHGHTRVKYRPGKPYSQTILFARPAKENDTA